jgi:hypothetical protein
MNLRSAINRVKIIMALSNPLKLYQSAGSPNLRRVRIFLAEKGLEPTLVSIDLGKGEKRSDVYRRISPRRVVPTLVLEDGTAALVTIDFAATALGISVSETHRSLRHWHGAVSSRASASA